MKISVVIVAYNEEKNIGRCLDSLIDLDYPKEDYEIIVVDGKSEDRTVEIVKKYKNVRLFVNPKRFTASSRNVGIFNSKYDYVAFTDADCSVPKDWLKILADGFKRHDDGKLAAVGGANIAPDDSADMQMAIWLSQTIYIGNRGSVQGKRFEDDHNVESLATLNVLYDKKKVTEIGFFDEDQKHLAEDWEINYRLRKAGYWLLFLSDSYVCHAFRTSKKRFFINMIRYGLGRMTLIKKHPESFSIVFMIPILFIFGMFSPFVYIFYRNPIFLLPLLYFPTMLTASIYLGLKHKKPNLIRLIFLSYILLHFGYAIGEIKGMFSKKIEGY